MIKNRIKEYRAKYDMKQEGFGKVSGRSQRNHREFRKRQI